jgi:cytochrome P450
MSYGGGATATPNALLPPQLDPKQSQREKLNRFEKITKGGARASSATVSQLYDILEDKSRDDPDEPSQKIHGPLYGKGNLLALKREIIDTLAPLSRAGKRHVYWMQCQDDAARADPYYANAPRTINIALPVLVPSDSEMPYFKNVVVLSHPEDCERIARAHVRKQPNFTTVLFQSLIATTDNAHWARQRNYLNEVFLPEASLSKIFPVTWQRAVTCTENLSKLTQESCRSNSKYGVQMHEFYLHEAQAQLQMALFGMDEAFMERTNKQIRQVFAGNHPEPERGFGAEMVLEMLKRVDANPAFATAMEGQLEGKPVFGPLSKAVANAAKDLDMNLYDQFGNMMLILFAGHDTTAHTMTWLTFELARHPEYQLRLQREVDSLFEELGGREMTYADCSRLPFLTRCVMETLRLWTAVPNGSFRQLQYEDEIHGPGGKMVALPKGTFVQVVNWMRHRSHALWGADADVFNPDRKFEGNEIWGESGTGGEGSYSGTNPASKRFSPFTFGPRDCLGTNFAQMEMRAILASVFHRFSFSLSEPYSNANVRKNGPLENVQGTSGPRDITPEGLREAARRQKDTTGKIPKLPPMAMWLHVEERRPGKSRL